MRVSFDTFYNNCVLHDTRLITLYKLCGGDMHSRWGCAFPVRHIPMLMGFHDWLKRYFTLQFPWPLSRTSLTLAVQLTRSKGFTLLPYPLLSTHFYLPLNINLMIRNYTEWPSTVQLALSACDEHFLKSPGPVLPKNDLVVMKCNRLATAYVF